MKSVAIYKNGSGDDDDPAPKGDHIRSDWVRWLIGGLCSVVVIGGTAWIRHVEQEIDRNRFETQIISNKISRLEVSIENVEKQLDSMSSKMDKMLDEMRRQDAKK